MLEILPWQEARDLAAPITEASDCDLTAFALTKTCRYDP